MNNSNGTTAEVDGIKSSEAQQEILEASLAEFAVKGSVRRKDLFAEFIFGGHEAADGR